jgi:hypothetical protein
VIDAAFDTFEELVACELVELKQGGTKLVTAEATCHMTSFGNNYG